MLNGNLTADFKTSADACHQASSFSGDEGGPRPIAVGFSGGGDSTALLHLVCNWARLAKIPTVYAFIVNHDLRQGAEQEAQLAAKNAHRIGAIPVILTWQGDKPKTAIQESARQARYALMGNACRQYGVQSLWLGHHMDDQLETVLMRAQRGSGWRGLAGMRPVTAGNIWPALYGISLVRPLLSVKRETLQDYNRDHHLPFVEDPSNHDRRYERVRTRQFLSKKASLKPKLLELSVAAQAGQSEEMSGLRALSNDHIVHFSWGGIFVTRGGWEQTSTEMRAQWLQIILLAVSGQISLTSPSKRSRLIGKMGDPACAGATLGGGMVTRYQHQKQDGFLFVRDRGAVLGRSDQGGKPVKNRGAMPEFWDGRFQIIKGGHVESLDEFSGVTVQALGHVKSALSKTQKRFLSNIPHAAQDTLPCLVIVNPDEQETGRVDPIGDECQVQIIGQNIGQNIGQIIEICDPVHNEICPEVKVDIRCLVAPRYHALLR